MHVKRSVFVLLFVAGLPCVHCRRESVGENCTIVVAAAANMKPVMNGWTTNYTAHDPACSFRVIYGSSGKLYTQIRQGLKVDIFFSADLETPRRLVSTGAAVGGVKPYATGQSVLFIREPPHDSVDAVDYLSRAKRRIVIPDPGLAPYGRVAMAWLEKSGAAGNHTLIRSGNTAAAFVLAGNAADAGIVPLSMQKLAEGTRFAAPEHWMALPDVPQVIQGAVVMKTSGQKKAVERFFNWLAGDIGRRMLIDCGYVPLLRR